MKSRSASRNLAPLVLVLLLAALAAPGAAALPAGPAGTGAPHWDAGSFFGWLDSLVAGLFGGGAEEDTGPTGIYERSKVHADPDGRDVTSSSSDALGEKPPSPETEPSVR